MTRFRRKHGKPPDHIYTCSKGTFESRVYPSSRSNTAVFLTKQEEAELGGGYMAFRVHAGL